MKLRILRANVKSKDGLRILKPNDKVIEDSELESYRKSLKEDDSDSVLFNFEEVGEE